MKLKKILALLTILLLALTACSNEDNTGGNGGGGSDMKLSERAGNYEAIYEDNTALNITFEIKADGTFVWTSIVFTKLEPTSTATSFTVKDTQTGTGYVYLIDFANNKFIGSGSDDNLTRRLTKKQ